MPSCLPVCLSAYLPCILQLECSLNFRSWVALHQTELWPSSVISRREARPYPWQTLLWFTRPQLLFFFFFPCESSSINACVLACFCELFVSVDAHHFVPYQFYYSPHLISLLFCNPWPISLPQKCSAPASKFQLRSPPRLSRQASCLPLFTKPRCA